MDKPKRAPKANRQFAYSALAVLVSSITAIIVLGAYLQIELIINMRQSTELTFSAIYAAIDKEFNEVTNVCETMRDDPFLVAALEHESDDPEGFRANIADYLASNSERYGLSTMYLVSDRSMRYYLPDGSAKVLDPEHDEWDNWYTALAESNDDYHVDIDVDKHNTNAWTIFFDWRIIGKDGETLGVAGVGVDLDDVEQIARFYTDTFGMNVSFTSSDGTAYIGTDQTSVTEAHRNVSEQGDSEAVTTWSLHECTVSRYMPLVDWYLVVENDGGIASQSTTGLIVLSVILLTIALAVIAVLNNRMFSRERNELTQRANTDPLTGLLNRAGLEEQMQERLSVGDEPGKACLIIIDIDHFKEVNDTFGHAVGDQVLREVAAVLRGVFRESDVLSRPGGDEFAAFLPAMERGEALERRASELLERGRLTHKGDDGTEVDITLSFGIASAPQDGTNFDELSRKADAALYEAKRSGRNCYRYA